MFVIKLYNLKVFSFLKLTILFILSEKINKTAKRKFCNLGKPIYTTAVWLCPFSNVTSMITLLFQLCLSFYDDMSIVSRFYGVLDMNRALYF